MFDPKRFPEKFNLLNLEIMNQQATIMEKMKNDNAIFDRCFDSLSYHKYYLGIESYTSAKQRPEARKVIEK